ncbi:TadE/TadG family type IV pilus assembly protein [Symbiobacterium thermophilum]|uniref:TadE/TadG family type IV pilus assembly protein n=1 Tax=Symbiobacterium thermophilum TaxID=2734 RepID=UPI0035C6CB01
MRKVLAGVRGSIAVETAITLPLVLLLTVGGISVLLWLHHKTWMQALVAGTARERAADAAWTGYYKDIRDSLRASGSGLVLADVRLFSFHLPVDPPFVVAGACAAPAGRVPRIGTDGAPGAGSGVTAPTDGGGWLSPVQALRGQISRWLERLEGLAAEAEDHADAAVMLAEQAVWYRRVADNLAGGDPFRVRQAVDYLAGAAVEEVAALPCRTDGSGEVVLTAKAVIQGERTFGQR